MTVKGVQDYSLENNSTYSSDSEWKRNPAWLPVPEVFKKNTSFNSGGSGLGQGSSPFVTHVYDIKIQSDNKILVCGVFDQYNGTTGINCIARFNTDGSYDSSFNTGTGFAGTYQPKNIALQTDGKILVGGGFTSYNGTTANSIIRLNSNGSIDSSFSIGTGFNDSVSDVKVQSDGKIIVGGSFTSYNGTTANCIIRLNSDGSIDNTFNIGTGLAYPSSFPSVNAITIQSDGKILVGGAFKSYNGTTANSITRLNSDGSIDSSFNVGGSGIDIYVFTIKLQSDNKILVGGYFTSYNGSPAFNLIRLNSDGSLDSSFYYGIDGSTGLNNAVRNIVIGSNGKIIAVGDFTTFDSITVNYIVRLNNDGTKDSTFYTRRLSNLGFNSAVYAVVILENNILCGGTFTLYQGVSIYAFAYLSNDTDQVCILKAVFPKSDNVGGIVVTSNYNVDWGDGTTETFTNAVPSNHLYNYADADLANTDGPVTFTDIGDLVTRTNHGYSNGDIVKFYTITTTTGINENATYYVINSTRDTFQISNTAGGPAIVLTNNGSGTLLPYKQAWIIITPDSGFNITSISLHSNNPYTGTKGYETGYLDMLCSIPNITSASSFGIGTQTVNGATVMAYFNMLERVTILNYNISSTSFLFYGCSALKSVPLFNTASVTNMSNMFNACYSLESVPLFNTASVTNMAQMFNSCSALKSVPLFNTASVTSMSGMFSVCSALKSVPLFNTASVTSMSGMFQNCYSLESVRLFNTANVTDMTSMFYNCYSLESVPLFNTASVTNMSNMFYFCYALESVPLFNTASVTNMSFMFYNCRSLQSVPLFNTANVTDMGIMFAACTALKSVPLFNTANVVSTTQMFNDCSSLQLIPLFDLPKVTNISYMFSNCTALREIPAMNLSSSTTATPFCIGASGLTRSKVTGMKATHDYSNCSLGANELNEIYTNLDTVVMGAGTTITVTGNYGTASDNPTIATNKNWTVTG